MPATPTQLAIATLYSAAFNRAPDAAGFDFWLQAYGHGATLPGLAATFLSTPEGQTAYPPGMTSQAFVAAFYSSVFGRAADAGGLQFWSAALDALGGAGSASAKAALMADIIGIASTPLPVKPAGLSDEAYAQTVADRARFLNKAEVGVYFATELRSNDLALAKQVLAGVTADPASVTAARTLAEQAINPPVNPPVTPPVVVPALTSADDVATITSKLAAYGGTLATADTTGMDAAQLKAIAAGVAKFKADGLTGALSLSSTVTALEAGGLLAKYSGTTASAIAVDMDAAQLAVLASASTKLAAGGISGTIALVGSLDATQLTALMGKLDANAAVTADVSGMQASQLALLAAKPLALAPGALTGALALSAPLTSTPVAVLLNRYAGTDATLLADNVDSGVLRTAVASIGKIASVSGDLVIPSDVPADSGLLLLSKYTGANAVVNASLFNSTQLQSLYGELAKLATVTQPKLVLADSWLTAAAVSTLLAKSTGASITATGADGTQMTSLVGGLGSIADDGIVGTLEISRTTAAAPRLETLFQKTAVDATVSVNAVSMDVDQVVLLFAQSAKIDTLANLSVPAGTLARLDASFEGLLLKQTGILMDLTGASAAQLARIVTYSGQFAAEGLTGVFSLDQSLDPGVVGVLLGLRVGVAADVTVKAAGMSDAHLLAVAQGIGKADAILGLSLTSANLAALTDSQIASVLAKANSAAVNVDGLGGTRLTSVLQSLDHVGEEGLSGTLQVDSSQLLSAGVSTLNGKLASTATLRVAGTSDNDSVTLTGLQRPAYVDLGDGADTITLAVGAVVFLGGQAQTRSGFSAADTSADHIDQIMGLGTTTRIRLSTATDAFGTELTFTTSTNPGMRLVNWDVSDGAALSFDDLYARFANSVPASTAADASLLKINITGNSTGLKGEFLVINDSNAAFDINDTIIKVGGSFTMLMPDFGA